MRLGTHLILFNHLVLVLLFHQESFIILRYEVVDTRLLRFDVLVGVAVREEVALEALMHASRCTRSVRVEPGPARVLHVLLVRLVVLHARDPVRFLFVLASSEVLQPLEIANSLGSALLILPQFVDPRLDLLLLVVHSLGQEEGIHHAVLGVLRGEHGANAGLQVLEAVLASERRALSGGSHRCAGFCGSIHLIPRFWRCCLDWTDRSIQLRLRVLRVRHCLLVHFLLRLLVFFLLLAEWLSHGSVLGPGSIVDLGSLAGQNAEGKLVNAGRHAAHAHEILLLLG